MVAVITGAGGLIGSQAANFFHQKGYKIIGLDNDMRSYFFGDSASTKESIRSLVTSLSNFKHIDVDIRNYPEVEKIFKKYAGEISIIIHTAAQPSHDWAANEPLTDFSVNALGTLNLLELTRLNSPKATFIFTSTNKVYGDRPNYSYYTSAPDAEYKSLSILELEKRYEGYFGGGDTAAVDEKMSIDYSKHSIFGASKIAADIMCQEYGRYFGINTGVFRGGCLTGPNHAGTELHGFLSYLVKCVVHDRPYTIFGYKGKQVRDNIHSWDLVNMFWEFHKDPKAGEVYNAGGGRHNSISILEAIDAINEIAGTNWKNYTVSEKSRSGDHIWYITDLNKFKTAYPSWEVTINLNETLKQMVEFEKLR